MYLNKEELRNEVKICLENKKISNKLAGMFLLIARNFASSFDIDFEDKQDMVQKAVEFNVKYYKKLDVNKDPFAYITQTCKNAFYQFFNGENKYKKFKGEMLTNAAIEFEKRYKNK